MRIDKRLSCTYNIAMKAVDRYFKKLLIIAIVLSVMLVVGVPMIILGATNQIYAVMGIGIAFTALGFYCTPVAWSIYGANMPMKRVVRAIVAENLYTVQEISSQLSMSEQHVREFLDKAFNKGFLEGYKRSGDVITLNENMPASKRERTAECPNCGAKFTYTADNARCPYCNSPVMDDGHKN